MGIILLTTVESVNLYFTNFLKSCYWCRDGFIARSQR